MVTSLSLIGLFPSKKALTLPHCDLVDICFLVTNRVSECYFQVTSFKINFYPMSSCQFICRLLGSLIG